MAEKLWTARKRTSLLGLPWTTTVYELYNDKLLVIKGLLSTSEDEIRLYRITDMTLKRSLWQKLLGLGTIHLCTTDATAKELNLKNIRNCREIRDLLSEKVEADRKDKRVYTREGQVSDCLNDDVSPCPGCEPCDHHH